MVTEEQKGKKLCCFYASEYHLEMILLPYIKNNLKNSNFTIFTQKDLSKSINLLLERINLKKEEKEQIKNLNWKKKNNIEKDIKKNIIINGDLKYIENIKKELSKIKENNFDIVYCYNIEYLNENRKYFEKNYDGILNTKII